VSPMPLFDTILIHTNKLTCSGLKDSSIEGNDNTIHDGPMADAGDGDDDDEDDDDDDEGAVAGTRVLAAVKLAKTIRK
jgi:hypothetical protein